jgi:hypothetical protein
MLKFTSGSNQPQKSISTTFEPHLSIFVDAQDKCVFAYHYTYTLLTSFRVLAEMLAPHRKKGKPPPRTSLETQRSSTDETGNDEQPMAVLPSSTELFYFYGQSLDQCAKLSTGQPLFDLCNLHKKWLRVYAGSYHSYISNASTKPRNRGGIVLEWTEATVSPNALGFRVSMIN